MGIFDTYSKRRERLEKAGQPDVYVYDELPDNLRVQIVHIWLDAIGSYFTEGQLFPYQDPPPSNYLWQQIYDIMCRELGELRLSRSTRPHSQCIDYLLNEQNIDNALDIIEVSFRIIDTDVRRLNENERRRSAIRQTPDEAITELNHRFKEHSVGYQYVNGKIIQVDSQYVHAEVVRPAISLLKDVKFEGAEEEFLKAHEHYRNGRHKEAIAEANKAFESTMKSICSNMKWKVPANATASRLIETCLDNELIPSSLQSHFNAFQSTLKDGLPTVRNIMAGHGQGPTPIGVPDYLAAYALHLAATNIVFLVNAYLDLK